VEFIGREKARAYLHCKYCKVKQQIQRELSHTIKSRCACVWMYVVDIYGGSPILLCSLKTYLSLETRKYYCKRTGAILFISFFFLGEHLSIHCFQYLGHLSIFSQLFFSSFFMNNFCIAPCLISAIEL
jgi:hypothetical protein